MSELRSPVAQPSLEALRHTQRRGRPIGPGCSPTVQRSVRWAFLIVLAIFLLACADPMAHEESLWGWKLNSQGMLPDEFFDASTACLQDAVEKFDDGEASAETVGKLVALNCFDYMQPLIEADFQGEELTRAVLEERAFLIGTGAVLSVRNNSPESRLIRRAGLD